MSLLDFDAMIELQNAGKTRAALDLIFDALCSFDINPDYKGIDDTLALVNPSVLKKNTMIAFLTSTYSISNSLKEYKPLLEKIRVELSKTISDEEIKELLAGFDKEPTMRIIFK
jgi:hypothetical protein